VNNIKRRIILTIPYVFVFWLFSKIGEAYRLAPGKDSLKKFLSMSAEFRTAMNHPVTLHPFDLLVGFIGAMAIWFVVFQRIAHGKKWRRDREYGSARWATASEIKPFMDPDPDNNIILTKTEGLTMNSRPSDPKLARNKNVLVIGGSGSGKTRFFVLPNLLQCQSKKFPVSYICTDPKGELVFATGSMLCKNGYKIRILNTVDFKKSMHYNPLAYIHSEKDILKLVNVLIANTKGEGKAGEEFWTKSEALLYTALIAYIHYEAPEEEQNFSLMLDFLNEMEIRENDETFRNAVDRMFDRLAERDPEHFAVRQYKKFKLAAGVVSCEGRFNQRLKQQEISHLRHRWTTPDP